MTKRLSILQKTIYLLFLVNLGRFFYLQLIKGHQFRQKIFSQNYHLEKLEPVPGTIFSSDDFPLALNQDKYELSVYKPDLKIPVLNLINKLSQIQPDNKEDIQKQLVSFGQNDQQKWITLPFDFEPKDIASLNLPGLVSRKVVRRYLPEDTLSKPVINAIEKYYQQQLNGKNGYLWTPRDAVGSPILTQKNWQIDAIDGRNLHLNINRSVQYLAEEKLKQGIRQYQADSGSVIILDSQSGKVITLTSQNTSESASMSAKIIPVTDLFEPGSIFKPLVVAIGLDNHSIDQNFVCPDCHQSRTIGPDTINNWDNQFHPQSNLRDIIKNSDNIGMSAIIQKIGLDSFLKYFHLLGLDRKTGIDLIGEVKPPPKKYWSPFELATASFGQGFAVSQIQVVAAFNTLANNGNLQKPRIVDHFSQGEQDIFPKPILTEKVFQPSSVDTVREILKYSVENGAVASLKPDNLEVCAKSGTAQVATLGGYANTQANASYLGFAPCQDPKITMLVTLNNPKTSTWGSSTAAPIWFEIADAILKLL